MSVQELSMLLDYDPDTGEFTWNTSLGSRVRPGMKAGTVNSKGYLKIKYKGKIYRAHYIAWLMCHKGPPPREIDHINGDKLDNRIANLRPATRSENNCNVSIRSDNSSGFKGVSWQTPNNKWVARISFNRKRITVGFFNTKEEAAEAYKQASLKYHGEYSPFN